MLLMTTDRPITQIAFDSGYDTHESFTRAFRQMFGVSPSQFRAGQRGERQVPHSHPTKEATTMTTLTTTPEVRIRTIEPLRVAFLRHIGPYQDVGPTFERFMGWAARRGLFVPGALVLGISWDNPDVTAPEKIRYDCCITVGPDFQAEGEVGVQTLDGGDYAVATHQGSYTELGAVWGWLYGTWLPASGREPRNGPSFSVYPNTPQGTPPEQLVTDIYLPLEPR
jgi:AraC family transcriptional regulator